MTFPLSTDSEAIFDAIARLTEAIETVGSGVGSYELISEALVPRGLMRKARTFSWLVEQVYTQQMSRSAAQLGFASIHIPEDDLIRYDLEVTFPGDPRTYYVNIKTGLASSGVNKNDVTKADKLANFYYENRYSDSVYLLADIRVDLDDDNRTLVFEGGDVTVMNVAWLPPEEVYVNGANRNLQARPDRDPLVQPQGEFVRELIYGGQGILNQEPRISLKQDRWEMICRYYQQPSSPAKSVMG